MAEVNEKIALVSGATDGIGKQTALELAQKGMLVFVHGRSLEKVQAAIADLKKQAPNGKFDAAVSDYGSLAQVRQMAADLRGKIDHLDVLVNNAGVKMLERKVSEDGYELTFAINHLAHFVLTDLLLDLLRKSPQGRVITVSSVAHTRGTMHFDDLQLTRGWDSYTSYAQSKLANVLFAYALARRLEGTAITSNAVHPGAVSTKLLIKGFGSTGRTIPEGAASSVYAATRPELATVTGKYFGDQHLENSAPATHDVSQQDKLWAVSEQLAGVKSKEQS